MWENLRSSIETRKVRPERNTGSKPSFSTSTSQPNIGAKALTEGNPLPEDIDVDAQERCQPSGEKQVETRHPSANNRTLLQPLLRKLPTTPQPRHYCQLSALTHVQKGITHVEMDTKDCTPAFSKIANSTTSQNENGSRLMARMSNLPPRAWPGPVCRLPLVWSVTS